MCGALRRTHNLVYGLHYSHHPLFDVHTCNASFSSLIRLEILHDVWLGRLLYFCITPEAYDLQNKTRDVITLFHKANVPSSTRILTFLKQTSAAASETATEDQASDHTAQNKIQRSDFDLDIVEDTPTHDQVKSILEYVGPNGAGNIIKGATSESDALKKFSASADAFQRPVVVDWSNGKAGRSLSRKCLQSILLISLVAGDNQSEILKMLSQSSS